MLNQFQKSYNLSQSKIVLFSDCIPVKGVNRSIICDTRNNNFHIIPNGLYDILEEYNGKEIEEIKSNFNHQFDEIINEYIDFLIENKLIFFSSNPELFSKITLNWSSPSLITNIIIDYDEIVHNFKSLIIQFETLKAFSIQLRFFKKIKLSDINEIVELLKNEKSRIVSIYFIIPFNEEIKLKEFEKLVSENSRIHSFTIFNSPFDKIIEPNSKKMGHIMQVKRNILNEKNCGLINEDYFYSNIKLFSESQHHNTCLNRKISIDKNGDIRNCPSMPESFGNIKDTTLEKALNHSNFKKYWNINKDQIDVCKDCEFRHLCTDCRAYVENPKDQYSKPLKCGYNPYTNVWEEWSTNPLKQKAIEFYGMQELVKKNV